MTRAHDAALLARLSSEDLAGCVYLDKPVPEKDPSTGKPITKYLRVRSNGGLIVATRLAGQLGPRTMTYWLTGVGNSPGQAAWVLEQATEQLLNWVPTVTGWSCRRMEPASSQPVDLDPERDGRYFGVDTWDLFAEPHPA